jgi:uncharacterized membrane protein (UPF0127 family)
MAWLVSDGRVLASAELAGDRRARSRGLLGRDGLEGALVLQPCKWVHTIGMRFPIDVAYLDGDGVVVKTVHMRRHRFGVPVFGARWVIEAAGGAFARWGLRVGDVVELRGDDTAQPADGDHHTGDSGPRRHQNGAARTASPIGTDRQRKERAFAAALPRSRVS